MRLENEEEEDDQYVMPEQTETVDSSKHFGDYQGIIQEGSIRLLFANIHGISANAAHPKNSMIKTAITNSGASIIGFAETNISWNKLRGYNRWEERSLGWWEDMNSITNNNTMEKPKKFYQPGGNMMITRGQAKYRIVKKGTDPSNMGRWCWQLFSGKTGVTTRIITAYRPCKSRGLTSTYIQQKRIMDMRKIDICPRLKMIEDLSAAIETWMAAGDQIILMLDLNDDVTNSAANDKLISIGLTECITHRHDNQPYATCNRGTKAIDGIYVSSTIMIQRGGYCPFNTFPTDHRAIWIDLPMSNLCGNKMAPILHPQARRLKCNDPKTQDKWTKLYLSFLKDRNAIQRAYTLQEQLVTPLPEEHIIEYEKLRRIRKDARQYADKKCRKLRMGGVPFSVELTKARTTIEMWKTLTSWKLGRKTNKKHLHRLIKKAGLPGSVNATLEECKQSTAQAFTMYWDVKRRATDLRITFLQTRAKELSKVRKLDENNVYLQLIASEQQRRSARKIKFVLHKVLGGGVTKISILNQQGNWEETTNKQEIEQGCAEENASKYRQTEGTPCMNGQLQEDLGYLGNTTSSQAILDGTYIPPEGTNQYVTEFIQHLQYDPNAHNNPPSATLPTEKYIQGWKNKKEFISAGKSGWTFSHSKTCALNQNSADFEATMAHIPYITGYTPLEWQVGVDIMIYKKANLDRVDKLRTIVLKEADANFNDGRLGKEMMDHAERHNMIAREQYGSRKGHSSIDHAVNKRLSYDLMRSFRHPGALCSNDAKSCYDRILHSITAIALKRLGMPEPPIDCMLKCIQKMAHYIRTTHGDSELSYTSKHTHIPFQGVLQGNGASPSIWVAVSTPLLNMMRQAQHGMQITSAISKIKSTVVAFAFVDDTDLIQGNIGNVNITANQVMTEMQQAILRWEGGLKATGGALVPEKSFVYPIDFKFDNAGKALYKSVEEINAHFEVPDKDDEIIPLQQLEPSCASETLGVFLAPDGNNNAAKAALLKKSKFWSELIHKGHLTATDVIRAMDTTIMQSLKYPLPALTLTEAECKSIMAPILDVALPQSHICRTFPRAAVYGPKSLMGLGKTDLYVRQGTTQIAILQQYLQTNTITGELLRANIEAVKMHLGMRDNIFNLDYKRLHQLAPSSLIKHIWQFCNKNNIHIEETTTTNMIPRRENDKFIMEVIAAGNNLFTNNELAHINRCRLYLQASTLSDITNGNGMQLRRGSLKGHIKPHNQSYYNWPRQARPGATSWRLWRKALKRCFMRGVDLHLLPTMRLGRWNDGKKNEWNWFFLRRTQKVFQRTSNTRWRVYRRIGRGTLGAQPAFTYMSDSFGKPSQALRCTMYVDTNGQLRMSGSGRDIDRAEWLVQPPITLLNNNSISGDVQNIIDSIESGNAKAVSDGSYIREEGVGTAGWIVEGNVQGNQLKGQYETPGSKSSQCSHRSKMWGILGIIMTVNAFCKTHNITNGSIMAKCDGEGTINILQWLHPITKNSRRHFDIILSLKQALDISPIHWDFAHLEGHQDKHTSFSQLDRWAQLNVLVDAMAKEEVTRIINTGERQGDSINIPYNSCTISWATQDGAKVPISSHLSESLMEIIQKKKLKSYWEKKKNIGEEGSKKVDWEILERSAKNYPRWKWLSKYVTGICGVGFMLKVWKHQQHDSCPRCGHEKEKADHVIRCTDPSATTTWTDAVNNLETWMIENNGEPYMINIICTSLKAWRSGLRLPFPTIDIPQIVLEAMIDQDSIGWYNFTNGFISRKWRLIQKAHFKDIRSLKSPDLWMTKLQRRIWEIAWQMWRHRNDFLHNDGTTIHFQESAATNREIRKEYDITGNGLPASYQYLFQGDIETLINCSIHTKQDWLRSVWVARDHHMPTQVGPRDSLAESSYLRWKNKFV